MNEQENHSLINEALNHVLRPMLSAYVTQNLQRHFGSEWWWRGVLNELRDDQKRHLPPRSGDYATLTDSLDVSNCLRLIDIHWREVFSEGNSPAYFNYIKEVATIRNLWAHNPDAFDDAAAIRALDTMALVSDAFDEETAAELREMKNIVIHRNDPKPVKPAEIVEPVRKNFPKKILPAWRDVIEPNSDVARNRYRQAEFALNLADIVRKEGRAEYINPVEFFERTYLTGGLKNLLVGTLKRLTDGNGEPVVQLKTSFGGGKSHSLLALYHLFGGIRADQSSAVREILAAANIPELPKVHRAVIVGTWENPLKSTLWGELAMQLANSTGKSELYDRMRENDEKKISPGVELLKKIFDEAGACLVLIDELVAYGRKLNTGEISDGGTVDNLVSFIQELTEAAKSCPKTAVVVSIPESDAEIGGDLGRYVLKQVEKIFGRMELVWSPVTVTEGYEIVRRRLFKPCRDERARENICAAFFDMYADNRSDFPTETQQKNYRERLMSCFPIHPKLFDYLYEKWTVLENFQKTRGVLRLMSKVIYELWARDDKNPLIMPANIPLDAESVRDELTKLLGGNWDAIVNAEVDGERSKPCELDNQNPRYGRLAAARKISRAIFMGTAPGTGKGDVLRGVDENEIRLATVQPQEVEDFATFNDALIKLKSNSYYLYSQGTRLWFGVNPTLRKLVDDKREQITDDEINNKIEERLKDWKKKDSKLFKAVHICPKNSADIPDEQAAQLVILSPKYVFMTNQADDAALEEAQKILDTRGTHPRINKNMLLFLAADAENFRVLKNAVRDFIAWSEVNQEILNLKLNLDMSQLADATNNLETTAETFAMKISQAYSRLIAPQKSEDGRLNLPLKCDLKIDCTKENNISAASEKFSGESMLSGALGPNNLLALLDKFIWSDTDYVEVGQLWNYFTTYYYLPRLVDENVLLNAVRRGVAAKTFALAEKFFDGEYLNVQYGTSLGQIPRTSLIVKSSVVEKLIEPPVKVEPTPDKDNPTGNGDDLPPPPPPPPPNPLSKRFHMDEELDNSRLIKVFRNCVEDVVSHLMNQPNSKATIRLVVDISAPEGVPTDIKEMVVDNCRDLKITNFRFEP